MTKKSAKYAKINQKTLHFLGYLNNSDTSWLIEINRSQEVNINRMNIKRVYFGASQSLAGCKAIIVDSMNLYCLKRTDCFWIGLLFELRRAFIRVHMNSVMNVKILQCSPSDFWGSTMGSLSKTIKQSWLYVFLINNSSDGRQRCKRV